MSDQPVELSLNEHPQPTPESKEKDYEEFEVGEHQVPWFLWVFFLLIVSWASVSWIKFFGY